MSFDQRLLSLNIADRRQSPGSFAMVATPPEETELCLDHFSATSRREKEDHHRSRQDVTKMTPEPEDPMTRIYRYTPVPTIILDASLHIVQVSDSHLEFSHQTRDTLLNTSIYEIPPPHDSGPGHCNSQRCDSGSHHIQGCAGD
ncbi:hypothetical protein AWENTII_011769 [Aspergillus wentii]